MIIDCELVMFISIIFVVTYHSIIVFQTEFFIQRYQRIFCKIYIVQVVQLLPDFQYSFTKFMYRLQVVQ